MTLRVKMLPHVLGFSDKDVSGINTVVRKYYELLPNYDIKLVGDSEPNYDLLVTHAGLTKAGEEGHPQLTHCHGLYWTHDKQNVPRYEHGVNQTVLKNIRNSKVATVPSAWVARVFQRDMRFTPDIVPHGVDTEFWQPTKDKGDYILAYAKNRAFMDVCNPTFLVELARRFPDQRFLCTLPPRDAPPNVEATGLLPYDEMRDLVSKARVVMSPIQETFGILTLEAMAAGVPVLGIRSGGNRDLVRHGETGYLYTPNHYDDMAEGLNYCLDNAGVLGSNARDVSLNYTWETVMEQLVKLYHRAAHVNDPTVGVVIPVYNKPYDQVERAVASVVHQTTPPDKIILVDDGSDNSVAQTVAEQYDDGLGLVEYVRQENSGVAIARNHGASLLETDYVSFLDADDWLDPEFIATCLQELESDPSLHLAYTGITTHYPDGNSDLSQWPPEWEFDQQIQRRNQVPTANVMRLDTFRRMGGYRARYAPTGAGSEDAELWTRMGAYGYKAKRVTRAGMFNYSLGQGHTSQEGYSEVDWLQMHPWVKDGQHPFASYASPLNNLSHLIRSYDHPSISVIVPVGEGHEREVINALDSVDAQTIRNFEVIVVWDTPNVPQDVIDTFPHTQVVKNGQPEPLVVHGELSPGKPSGAGYARNIGVEYARGSFVIFLDADDSLYPRALQVMLEAWRQTETIIYSDYVGVVDTPTPDELISQIEGDPNRKLLYRKDNRLVVRHTAGREFDCEKALSQPPSEGIPYVWALVTCLIPKLWHEEIGGFDPDMPSFEDVDYMWRMARQGKCFTRVNEELVTYRYSTGQRRHVGLQKARSLLEYLRKKYQTLGEPVACNCGGKKVVSGNGQSFAQMNGSSAPSQDFVEFRLRGKVLRVGDGDVQMVEYLSGAGANRVLGTVTGIDYGYRKGGETFLMHQADVYFEDNRGGTMTNPKFRPVDDLEATSIKPPVRIPPAPQPIQQPARVEQPELVPAGGEQVRPLPPEERQVQQVRPSSETVPTGGQPLTDIEGVGPAFAEKLKTHGIMNVVQVIVAGEDTLRRIEGIGDKAATIWANAVKLQQE